MVRKSLHNPHHFAEIIKRINSLTPNSPRQWGEMEAAQMLKHCEKILKVAVGQIKLADPGFFVKMIGITAKKEMWLFNNGIPPNMPTFKEVIVKDFCIFERSRKDLMDILEEFLIVSRAHRLPPKHPLFGRMHHKHWGFMEYKHLNHHLKQFSV